MIGQFRNHPCALKTHTAAIDTLIESGRKKMKIYKPAEDLQTDFQLFANRRRLIQLICLGLLLMGAVLSGCDTRSLDASAQTNSEKDTHMESMQTSTTIQPKIPPIDAAVVPGLQTATFALG